MPMWGTQRREPSRSGNRYPVARCEALLGLALWLCLWPAFQSLGDEASDGSPAPTETPLTAADHAHWAYQPLHRSIPPAVQEQGWCRTPIDQFILVRLEAAGLSPLPEADKETLLRRVTLDLTGLPPQPEEIDAFLADRGPDAYERVVDRLLASPTRGERWAQHWLDLARFAETDGFEHDLERPVAWRYRDWVIEAVNRDLPLDDFIRCQLAGDELQPDDPQAAIATGFLLCGPDMPDINLAAERRSNFLNDLTGTVGSVLLGLQVGCAQCHDHKYDPISQGDFYRLRAFFDPLQIFQDHPLPKRGVPVEADAATRAAAEILLRDEAELRRLEEGARSQLKSENPDLQPTRADLLNALDDERKLRHADLSRSIASLKAQLKMQEPPLGRIVRESGSEASPSRLLIRGDFRREGPQVGPQFPRIANREFLEVVPPSPGDTTSGRRTQLAQWLTRADHPLVTRVLVNRLWQFHFGRGIVETASDFGKMGAEPTHAELLDWLATELPRRGWSLQQFQRLIVTSAVYRQGSRPPARDNGPSGAQRATWDRARRVDPDNRLLWHWPRQRLDGETIRDALLAIGGVLHPARGGPGVRPPLPPELVATLLKNQWNVSPDEADHRRRSVYLFVRRNVRFPLFEAFDRPDANASCARRNRSTIAPQALILLNSEFSLGAARDLAGRLYAECGDDSGAQVRLAYRLLLGRAPDATELLAANQFLIAQTARLQAAQRPVEQLALPLPLPTSSDPYRAAAVTDFCLALCNLNEFVYID